MESNNASMRILLPLQCLNDIFSYSLRIFLSTFSSSFRKDTRRIDLDRIAESMQKKKRKGERITRREGAKETESICGGGGMKDPGKRGDRERGPGRQGKRGIANSSMRCTCSLILRGAYYNNFFLLLVYVSSTSRTLHFQFNLININWMITVIVSVCVCLFGMRNVIVECVNIEHKHVHKIHICINIQ